MSSGSQTAFSGFTFYPSSEAGEAFEHWMDEMIIYEGYVPPNGEPIQPEPVVLIAPSNLKLL